MRVLITGGAGFVGSAVGRACAARGHTVVALDDLSSGRRDRIPEGAWFTRGSVLDARLLTELVHRADRVFHCAGTANPAAEPRDVMRDLAATEVVLDACAETRTRLLIPSTGQVHGRSVGVARETDAVALPPPRAGGPCFAAGKLLMEASALHRPTEVVVARLFDVAGPFDPVVRMANQARAQEPVSVPGSGEQLRAPIHVDDAAELLLDLMEAPEAVGRITNVGGSEEASFLRIARRLKQLTRSSAPIMRVLRGVQEHELVPRRVACLGRLSRIARTRFRSLDATLLDLLRSGC